MYVRMYVYMYIYIYIYIYLHEFSFLGNGHRFEGFYFVRVVSLHGDFFLLNDEILGVTP